MIFDKLFKTKRKPIDNKYVFDKAKFHDDTISKAGFDEEQAFVHTGFYFTWLIDNDLISDFCKNESNDKISDIKNRQVPPSDIYKFWDGVLIGELMNEQGYYFSYDYFDFDRGQYIKDYSTAFNVQMNDVAYFNIKDTWDNYDKIKKYIDLAFNKWIKK